MNNQVGKFEESSIVSGTLGSKGGPINDINSTVGEEYTKNIMIDLAEANNAAMLANNTQNSAMAMGDFREFQSQNNSMMQNEQNFGGLQHATSLE